MIDPKIFNEQIIRLRGCFGDRAYPDDRAKVIWDEVKFLNNDWLKKTVDKFIGELRQAPLLIEFREAASRERNLRHAVDKGEYSQGAQEFFSGSMHPEETKSLFAAVVSRLNGTLSQEKWDEHKEIVKNMVASSSQKKRCPWCDDSGVVYAESLQNKNTYTFLCGCSIGSRLNYPYPKWNRDRELDYKIC